jgi:hypothetical protein
MTTERRVYVATVFTTTENTGMNSGENKRSLLLGKEPFGTLGIWCFYHMTMCKPQARTELISVSSVIV